MLGLSITNETGVHACLLSASDLILFENPGDCRIFATGGEDVNVTVYGQKDEQGLPTELQLLVYKDSNGTDSTILVGEDGKIGYVISDTGLIINFLWFVDGGGTLTGASARVNLRQNSQVNVNIDLTGGARKKRSVAVSDLGYPAENVENELNRVKRQTSSVTKVPIHVMRCGEFTDATTVKADVQFSDGQPDKCLYGIPTGETGRYEICIPTEPAPTPSVVPNICDAFSSVLEQTCEDLDELSSADKLAVCEKIQAGVSMSPSAEAGDPEAAFKACECAFAAVTLVCAESTASECNSAAEANAVDFYALGGSTITVTPEATFPDGTSATDDAVEVILTSGMQVSVPVPLSVLEGFVVQSMYAVPADPDPAEDYIVYVYYVCPEEGSFVSLDIVGTDGYTDELICTAVNNCPNPDPNFNPCATLSDCHCCVLRVPGAVALVVDVVTFKTLTADPKQRELTLVF